MASWDAIKRISTTLVTVLQRHVDTASLTPSPSVLLVTPKSFQTLDTTLDPVISVYLYRIDENREVRNRVRSRDAAGNELGPKINVDLWYLITAWAARPTEEPVSDETAAGEEHEMVGLVLQGLAAASELGAAELDDDPLTRTFSDEDGVQIILESLPTDEHARIWDASELGYRLSLIYRVRLIGIDPVRSTTAPRVGSATLRFGEAT